MTTMFSASEFVLRPARGEVIDPLGWGPADRDMFDTAPIAAPAAAYIPQQSPRQDVQPANYQTNNQTPFADDSANAPAASSGPVAAMKDPCAAAPNKPLNELGISIAQPAGKLPTDLASPCWDQINQTGGQGAAARCWPVLCYQWDATCFCHQPLYFEEINLERYGYQCGDKSCCATCGREFCCLQPAASAAHFFGTIPMLPYCMAVEPPCECIYTLGHYRPGDCNPWRWHWPPCDLVAADVEVGVLTGLIFAIP